MTKQHKEILDIINIWCDFYAPKTRDEYREALAETIYLAIKKAD